MSRTFVTEPIPMASWSPRPQLVGLGWVFTALTGVWLVVSTDLQGRVIVGCACFILLCASLYGTILRPRLTADSSWITLRELRGKQSFSWSEVHYQVHRTSRFGRETATLELTLGPQERLIPLGRLELGVSPEEVYEKLRRIQGK